MGDYIGTLEVDGLQKIHNFVYDSVSANMPFIKIVVNQYIHKSLQSFQNYTNEAGYHWTLLTCPDTCPDRMDPVILQHLGLRDPSCLGLRYISYHEHKNTFNKPIILCQKRVDQNYKGKHLLNSYKTIFHQI